MMASRLLCLTLMVMLSQHIFAGFLDGGDSGDFGNEFLDGTANKEKLILGLSCVKSTPTDQIMNITFTVKENDTNFVFQGGPDKGELVTYESCQFLNVSAYEDNNMRLRMPGDECKLQRLDSTGVLSADDVDERTLATTLSVNLTEPGSVPCGGFIDGDEVRFLVECYRTANFSKDFGAVVQFQCLNSTAVAKTLTTNVSIGAPPQENVTRSYEVTQTLYWHKSSSPVTTNEEETTVVPDVVELIPGSGAPLGASVYIEVCLKIKDSNRPYFEDGFDPIGVMVGPVVFSNVESYNPVLDGLPSSVEVVDSDGCSLYRDPALQLGNETQAIKYLQPDGAESTLFYLRSPNCFRSREFELVAFVNKNSGLRSINITSTLDYCFSTSLVGDVNMCFGNITSTDDQEDGYTDCSGVGVARRKRQVNDILEKLPQTVTTTILIDTDESTDDEEVTGTKEVEQEDCFERETFIALTACLAFLLGVVMLVAMFLALRIHATGKEEKGSSISGYSNKGYY